jgi:hypothetical protein
VPNPIKVNGVTVADSKPLAHGDVIMITDRSFRFEYLPNSIYFGKSPKKSPKKSPTRTPSKILTPKVF